MKLKNIALIILLLMALLLTACGKDPESSPVLESVEPTVTASPSLTPTPSPTPVATEAPIEMPQEGPADISIEYSFESLAKEHAAIVIRGEYTKKLPKMYNAIRSMDDPADPDPMYIIDEEQYEFKITAIYKNDKDLKTPLKEGDVIIVNTPYSDLYTAGKTGKRSAEYMEIELNKDVVLFLAKFDIDPKNPIYRPDAAIYSFEMDGDKLIAQSYDQKHIDEWNKETKAPNGIPIANLKKDLGVK